MGAVRRRLLAQAHAPEAHKPIFEKLIQGGLLQLLEKKQYLDANVLIQDVTGEVFDVESLIAANASKPSN
jgi:precorrin-2 dehydrogenase/sirohydrochlorin ferrochelatase